MLNEYQLMVLLLDDARPFVFYSALMSGLYYWFSKKVLPSLHGALIILAFLYAAIISGYTEFGVSSFYYWPLHILLVLAIASAAYSMREFGSKRWVHLAHLGTLVSGAMVWFIGSMAIAHDWI